MEFLYFVVLLLIGIIAGICFMIDVGRLKEQDERFQKQLTVNANAFTEQINRLAKEVERSDNAARNSYLLVTDYLKTEMVIEPSKTYLRAKKSKK
jgi:uncharacterized membrane-anchored protein YhcB (DUF1043 family)